LQQIDHEARLAAFVAEASHASIIRVDDPALLARNKLDAA